MARETDMIYVFAVDPGINDDTVNGYTVGNDWKNSVTGEVFSCADATAGAAVWISNTRKAIVLQLGSSQAINSVSATTINFSSVLKNDIIGASVSGTGVVTLPIGEYKASYIINGAMQSGGARANVATAVVKGAGGGGGIVQGSIAYSYARNIGNPNGSNSCPNFQGGFMNYTAVGTFTVVSLRVGEAGPYNSILGQCMLVIEKIK